MRCHPHGCRSMACAVVLTDAGARIGSLSTKPLEDDSGSGARHRVFRTIRRVGSRRAAAGGRAPRIRWRAGQPAFGPEQPSVSVAPGASGPATVRRPSGEIPERPNGPDCKSGGSAFGGSNPPLPTISIPSAPPVFVHRPARDERDPCRSRSRGWYPFRGLERPLTRPRARIVSAVCAPASSRPRSARALRPAAYVPRKIRSRGGVRPDRARSEPARAAGVAQW